MKKKERKGIKKEKSVGKVRCVKGKEVFFLRVRRATGSKQRGSSGASDGDKRRGDCNFRDSLLRPVIISLVPP